jgi:Protein of unknown function (DUF3570)
MRVQLEPPRPSASVRGKLKAAACMLLASGVPAMARAADSPPATQLDVTGLLYGEASRVSVVEPMARITRLYSDGQILYAQFGVDVITGASPSGALPSGQTQTVTSASGNVTTRTAGQIPLTTFKDTRVALDGGWTRPFRSVTPTFTGHFSREKDYQSIGAGGKFSFDFMHHLNTLTMGAGYNQDEVFPVGGTSPGLADPSVILGTGRDSKHVTTGMIGLSHVFTRRWMMALNASRTHEQGYLTEPYKLLSVVDGSTGMPVGELTDKRPSARNRTSVLINSVYHLTEDVFYSSYRYYWDDWDLRSHTLDVRYRHELRNDTFLEPHLRFYTQSSSSFFRSGLIDGAPLPDFATSDYRLGPLTSVTVGATLGFVPPGSPGEWTVRLEYIGQFSDHHPKDAVGVQRQFDLYPTVNTASLVIGYHIDF